MRDAGGKNIGGYDDGYRACPCFWGRDPGSLMARLCAQVRDWSGTTVLDAGCGEGKNAIYLARLGARVLAVDVCPAALRNARTAWVDAPLVDWQQADIRKLPLSDRMFSVVLAYGLLHCLSDADEVLGTVRRLQAATTPGGYHVLCAFNDRHQDLTGHPGFVPTLLRHSRYLGLYRGWDVLFASDEDLRETHPHNGVPHVHSLTRLVARNGVVA